ncbi:hypothetical protein ACH95_00770 [Bacillus glycinifermentans]|uniref:hypothetical protein n=1 Tax=Bacillus glycinifermentans TaxID=1664069 RepID=UPI0006540625|nr:hypothetical protein ACH95_00770 [Bacillus glycinifermentans]
MTKTNEKIHVLADESLGGIKREYVEVDRKAKLGEKIVIVDADPGYGDHYSNGDVFTVELYVGYGFGVATECGHHVGKYEYRTLEPTNIAHIDGPDGTERYEMVDRKAEVGEKVIVTKSDDFPKGLIDTVEYCYEFSDYGSIDLVEGADDLKYLDAAYEEYRVLVPVESEEEPQPSDLIDVIANLATRVSELERENKRIQEELGWYEIGPGRIAELRNAVSDIRHDIATLEGKIDHDRAENGEMGDYVYEEMKRMKDEIDTLHKDNRRHGEELEALKYAAKETDGKVAHLEADIEESFPATDAPLVFICRKPGRFEVYQDGKKLHGVMSVRINAKVGEFATHEIEYISGATEEERQ